MQRTEEIQVGEVVIENNPDEEGNIAGPVVINDEEQQVAVDVEVVENVLIYNDEELSENYKELKQHFQSEMENLNHSTLLHIETREKLLKVTMSDEIRERANKILLCIYQVLIPYQRLPASYIQWEKLFDMQLE